MNYFLKSALVVCVAFVATACQTTTKIDEVTSMAAEKSALQRTLVVGIDITPNVQHAMEQAFSKRLSSKARSVVLASEWFPEDAGVSREVLAARVKAENVTGVLVTRLIAYETEVTETPAFSFSLAAPERTPGQRVGWEQDAWIASPKAGDQQEHIRIKRKAIVETRLYDTATGAVVWQARSRTLMSESESPDFDGFAAAIATRLKQSGLL